MSHLENIRANATNRDLIEGQLQHLGIAVFMGIGACSLLVRVDDGPWYLMLNTVTWAKFAIILAIVHQFVVAAVFRLQLYKNWMSKRFGDRDMQVWAAIFMPLLIARPLLIMLTGWSDTTPITGIRPAEIILGLALIGVAGYGLYSVLEYFTLPRALGGDHFRDEYAQMPLVNQGIYKYTDNGMYGVVFLGLSGIALLYGSWNALVVALFQHAYIWVHMYCTEGPDMRRIYGTRLTEKEAPPTV
ncbi:PEMT/PEM2 family methyltransferase [Falsihalocynthiibacter sp. SS001]|uniref:PEMT/PEM2 family methyltransferase n=1 Tax=Falsihalocynthiibacter sp. SS001 TaxID=3349698 RepID=UPI0036D39E33